MLELCIERNANRQSVGDEPLCTPGERGGSEARPAPPLTPRESRVGWPRQRSSPQASSLIMDTIGKNASLSSRALEKRFAPLEPPLFPPFPPLCRRRRRREGKANDTYQQGFAGGTRAAFTSSTERRSPRRADRRFEASPSVCLPPNVYPQRDVFHKNIRDSKRDLCSGGVSQGLYLGKIWRETFERSHRDRVCEALVFGNLVKTQHVPSLRIQKRQAAIWSSSLDSSRRDVFQRASDLDVQHSSNALEQRVYVGVRIGKNSIVSSPDTRLRYTLKSNRILTRGLVERTLT